MPYITRQDDISVLHLSVRSQNCLRRAGILTIGAMLDYPLEEFINLRNMGVRSVEEIKGHIQALTQGTGAYVLVEAGAALPAPDIHSPDAAAGKTVTFFLDETGAVVPDLPVQDLRLSIRAKNNLIRNGYESASQLVGISCEALMNAQGMGRKSAEEVLAYIARISVLRSASDSPEAAGDAGLDLAGELCAAYGEEQNIWLREIQAVKAQYPEAMAETLIGRLYQSVFVRGTAKAAILRIIGANHNEISKSALEEKLPQHLRNTTILEEMLLELAAVSAVEQGEVMIYRQYPSIVAYAAQIEDERIRAIVQRRIAGKTLIEIGEEYGITKERVRQLLQAGLKKRPCLREDRYVYLYEHYDFSLEAFTLAFEEPAETFYYLETITQVGRSLKKSLEELLTDTQIPPEYRKKVERAVYRNYIATDGVRIKMTRPDLVRHYVKTYCKNLTKFEAFVVQFNQWLDSLGIGEDPALKITSRAYENILNQSDYVLWNQWRSFRYYNLLQQDFDELLSSLDLEQYEDMEFSTLKLFRDYPALMAQYDIRDEYELHNLLKKILPGDGGRIKFKKMPTIEVGSADLTNQLLTLMLQYAPVTADDLANHYEAAYGVKALTVRSNYFRALDPYYYQGVYSVDFAALSSEQEARMKTVLSGDFYTIAEAKRLFRREFPQAEESLINSYTLKTLDFRVYSSYIIRNTYPSAADYFRSLLTTDDIVDARNISKAVQSVIAYASELYKLRADYAIVEFSPLQYINIRRLNAAGVTTDHFAAYCADVALHCEKGAYFTVSSLRKEGFTHEMDDLGFEEWFYSSVLLEDRARFSYQRIGGTRLFLRGKAGANLGDMLVWLLEQHQKMDFYDLSDLLENHYGIVLSREKLLAIIAGTELYYDTIMEAVYIDYDTYFEEI